jgi:von Willebrand factor type A domain-containing protein
VRALRVAGGAVTAVLVALVTSVPAQAGPAALAGPARAAAVETGQSGVAALDVVVLVDESGSETPQKVADEKQTVGTIVQTMLNPNSRVTVIGFGGVNHVVPDQNPVDVVCQPTIASGAANLDYLASCVGALHRRTEAEGDDTDYAAALTEAMHFIGPGSAATPRAPSGSIKAILMMTDGAVDVHRNIQQYGNNWQLGEQTAINQQLAAATSAGVQLWPLGFGADIGTGLTQAQALQYLNTMAAHGASAVCDTRHLANQPHATWVNDPDDAINALDQLYADAACLGTNQQQGTVAGGAPRTLTVNIPAIASAAAISVDRVNPAIAVTFTEPDGTQWTDASAISGADSNSPDEVLHLNNISDPDVGTWRVTLTAPQDMASQLVSATVFWQGAVRAIITATPSVNPGQPIAVKLTVLGPTGPVTDPATLKSLLVGVTASGQGLPSPVKVDVTQVGGPTGVGSYAGTYTAPSQPTTLTITGTAAGYGLYATQIPATVSVGAATRGFMATPHFSGATSVQAGGSISGSVDFTNTTGAAKSVLLKLTASGAIAAINPDTPIAVPSTTSGNPPSVPFTVTFSSSSPAGPAGLEVQAIDADTGQLYNTAPDEITVTTPPTFFDKYKWDGLGILALIILLILAALWRRRVVRDRKNVRGLVAMLRFGGEPAGRELAADEKYSEVFPFVIKTETTPPYLDHPARGMTTGVYQVRRGGRGMVRLMPPAGGLRPYEIEVGGPGQALGGELEVAFRDTRHPNWTGSGGGASAPGAYENTQGLPGMSSATTADDWSGGGAPAHQDWSGSGMPTSAAQPWTPSPPPPASEPGLPPTMPGTSPAPPKDPWL